MENSSIEWTRHTFNPWSGCSKVSPGCAHCYAEALMDKRWGKVKWGPEGTRVIASESYWKQPLLWNRKAKAAGERHRVFCASLADVFEDRPDLTAPRKRLFDLILDTPELDWLLLTKRPENIERLMRGMEGWALANAWDEWVCYPDNLFNVWLGVSVEDQQRADERIPLLLQTPAAVRFLSCEPLLGSVELGKWLPGDVPDSFGESDGYVIGCYETDDEVEMWRKHVDWVIVGSESGPRRRAMATDWADDVRCQCESAQVAFFMKQMEVNGCVTGDMQAFPEQLRVRQFPEARPL